MLRQHYQFPVYQKRNVILLPGPQGLMQGGDDNLGMFIVMGIMHRIVQFQSRLFIVENGSEEAVFIFV